MAKPKLIESDFQRAAKKLRCPVAAIKAVAEVESRGEGFYPDGFPVILFERHKFRQFTKGRYNATHPHLSGPAGNYGKAGQNQRNKFNEAFALNPAAALKSCSWGKFQIMGFNHTVCGFSTVDEFVDAMKESEGRQLDAFVNFVINNGLADELRVLNWAAFAKGYNGAGYKTNRYDEKMATAYKKHSKIDATPPQKDKEKSPGEAIPAKLIPTVESRQTISAPPEIIDSVINNGDTGDSLSSGAGGIIDSVINQADSVSSTVEKVQSTIQNATDKAGNAIQTVAQTKETIQKIVPVEGGGKWEAPLTIFKTFRSRFFEGGMWVVSLLLAVGSFIKENWILIAVAVGVMAVVYWQYQDRQKLKAKINSDPQKYNVE